MPPAVRIPPSSMATDSWPGMRTSRPTGNAEPTGPIMPPGRNGTGRSALARGGAHRHDGEMRMTSEPPAGYVAFVARHLEPLRRDAVRVVGGEEDADHLYVDVLTDVATRWTWRELRRTGRGPEAPPAAFRGGVSPRRSERF